MKITKLFSMFALAILAISFTACDDDDAETPNYSPEVTGQYISATGSDTVEVTSSSSNSLEIKNFGSSTALSSDVSVNITSKSTTNGTAWLTSKLTDVLLIETNDSTISLTVVSESFTGFKSK